MRTLAIIVALAVWPSLAEACSRCGNYRSCRYVSYVKPYYKPYVAPANNVVNTFVVQNAYPPTIGAGASYGVSNGGYQASVLPLFDANTYLAGRMELAKAQQSAIALDSSRADQLAERFASLQAPAVERLAAGQAAEMVLNAAGLTPSTQAPVHNAVLINRDSKGRVQIVQLDQQQVANVNGYINGGGYGNGQQYQQPQQQPQSQYPLLTQFCARCHSPDLGQARGKYADGEAVYIGDHATVAASMEQHFFTIVDAVSSKRMPPASEPQPAPDQVAGIFNEIQQIIKFHKANAAPRYQPQFQAAPSNEPPPAPLPPQPQQPQPLPQPQQGT